jgi:hypothetical protein
MAVLELGLLVDALKVDKHIRILQSIHVAIIQYPFHPQHLTAKHPPLIEHLIELEFSEHHQCVTQIINMIADLKLNGLNSRYLKKMKGPFLELKTASRGGDKGGARVYMFQTAIDAFYLCYPECKSGNEANAILLHKTLEIIRAFQNKQKLFPEEPRGES